MLPPKTLLGKGCRNGSEPASECKVIEALTSLGGVCPRLVVDIAVCQALDQRSEPPTIRLFIHKLRYV